MTEAIIQDFTLRLTWDPAVHHFDSAVLYRLVANALMDQPHGRQVGLTVSVGSAHIESPPDPIHIGLNEADREFVSFDDDHEFGAKAILTIPREEWDRLHNPMEITVTYAPRADDLPG